MEAWWHGLGDVNKGFAISALFFSVLFIWQVIGTLIGLAGDGGADHGVGSFDHQDASVGHDVSGDGTGDDAHGHHMGSDVAFSLVSIRSLLAFGMLFSWAGTLYLAAGTPLLATLAYSLAWGLVAMFAVSYLVYKLVRLQEVGTASLWTALGQDGVVYMNIPAGAVGKVRVLVSGAISYVNARSVDPEPLDAGTKVKVVGVVDGNILEVKAVADQGGE